MAEARLLLPVLSGGALEEIENTAYAEALMSAVPIPDPHLREQRQHIILEGEIPSARKPPPGCPFHPRCRYAEQRCTTDIPALKEVGRSGHLTACHIPERVQMQPVM